LARSAMEGATLGLAYGLRRFADLGLEAEEIRLTGGGSKSAVWRQIAADIFGVPVVGLATAEGASLGAAIQAAHANGEGDYDALCGRLVGLDESTRCAPDAATSGLYAEKLERFGKLTLVLHESDLL